MKNLVRLAASLVVLVCSLAAEATCDGGGPPPPPLTVTPMQPGPVWVAAGAQVPGGVGVFIDAAGDISHTCEDIGPTFTAPASGPSLVFPTGTNQYHAAVNIFESQIKHFVAQTPANANNQPGTVVVTALTAGAYTTVAGTFIIAGSPVASADIPAEVPFGSPLPVTMNMSLPWLDCTYASSAPGALAARFTVNIDGEDIAVSPFTMPSSCDGPTYRFAASAALDALLPGTHQVRVSAAMNVLGTTAVTQTVTVMNGVHAALPASSTAFDVAVGNALGNCGAVSATAGRLGDTGFPASEPSGAQLPLGIVHIDAMGCKSSPQRVVLTGSSVLPDGAEVWTYGPDATTSSAHWYPLRAAFSGALAMFDLADGGTGDDSLTPDSALHSTVAIVLPQSGVTAGSLQDLWWTGPAENGWGLSVTQHGTTLFSELFIYDAQGQPRWLVIPGGSWNAQGTAYTGSLYRPHGAPYYAYDANAFVVGNAVGTLKVTVNGPDSIALDYTIDGVSGTKSLHRERFGPPAKFYMTGNDDLWWGGVQQNGWGLALAQQGATLFGVLFTYDAAGNPLWFVAPAIADLSSFRVYRTSGSPWLGATYDPTKLSVGDVGSGSVSLGPDSGWLVLSVEGHNVAGGIFRQPF